MSLESFAERARGLGINLEPDQLRQFAAYRDLIVEAAGRFNLTAVRDPVAIERRHFLESLALGVELVSAGAIPADGNVRVIDVGAGAGLPGIPLKIGWPEMTLALLDSNEKRCRFLRQAIDVLELSGVDVIEGRAEAFGRDPGRRETYGLAVARAVAPLAVLIEYALPFLRLGGVLAAPKGSAAHRELAEATGAIAALGGELISAQPFKPPDGPPQTLVLLRKVRQTPAQYPRRPGIAARRPLI